MWKYNIRHQLNEDCLLWKYSFERWQWLAFWTERENIVWAECAPMSTSLTGSIMPQAFWSRLPCCIAYYLISFGNDRSNQIYDMLRDLVAKAFLLFDSAIDFSSYESLHRLYQGPSLVQVLTFCLVDLLTSKCTLLCTVSDHYQVCLLNKHSTRSVGRI